MFTILFGVLVTLIYFLFSFRDNTYQKNKPTTDFNNNIYQIVFTNKYNLPLLNKNIIPNPLQITEQMLGISIEEILGYRVSEVQQINPFLSWFVALHLHDTLLLV
ncbi:MULTISPECIES: hypothetical protein [unclassified Spiroplasma]|uniref:hypothetical protein n=1 Tax=unclassified Spiroplasma TaxID=2637901 RepID=UPI0037DDA4DB